MSTKQSTVEYIVDQISLRGVTTRKMFGEYALYVDDRVVGLICDETLFIKMTEPGRKFAGKFYEEGCPYPGAKVWMRINEDWIEDREWLGQLARITADNVLPVPTKFKRIIKN